MQPLDWAGWLAWAGIVLPLMVLAWSAWRFTEDRREERKYRRFEQFFSVTDKIGNHDGSLLSKIAAIYELRRFPEYADVISRMTANPDVRGDAWSKQLLIDEFKLTNEAIERDA